VTGSDSIRHVIFDLDGTLVDSSAACVDILSDMLAERGGMGTINPVVARAFMSRGGMDMVVGLLGEACTDPAADLAEFRARYQEYTTSPETVFPGVAQGLRRLQDAGYVLSICSNKPQVLCDRVLADTHLADHFAIVVGGRAGLQPKPAPDLLAAVLGELGAAPQECFFVGDSELDHEIARNAAVPFHFVTYGYAAKGWVPHACATHATFPSLIDTIVAHRRRA
jgi:phosphoglycolate phosphatase